MHYTFSRYLTENSQTVGNARAAETSIHALVLWGATRYPEAPAIIALDRPSLTYARLYRQIASIATWLNAAGIGRQDRIAIVLPNGTDMATACLGVSSCAIAAPLNPGYRDKEFDFYLSELSAKGLIVQRGSNSDAVDAARSRGIPVIQLSPVMDAEAGIFTLNGDALTRDDDANFAEADDIALVLPTSGTTSRPKMVPLTHTNLCASAKNVARSLALTEADRCLNIMPQFHIHGLVAATLASLWAGGSVVCTSGFDGPRFFEWMDEFRPSWYTAVPTMHQEILRCAPHAAEIIASHRMRFIRSSSAALSPQLMMELESVFQTPVIEAYGMTEAAHQMASNPLPPRTRKPGSVGLPTGCEVGVMDENGIFLEAGKIGEVVIRGPNVTKGYDNNPTVNAAAFTKGWFRTGDQGAFDEEGYLSLTGRLKEIINSGGEKIAPREIDEVLLKHSDVRQAVAFPLPHPTLGQSIAVAVTRRDGKNLSEVELLEFARGHLPAFKVPTRILILTEIPKGPTGKIQRSALAEQLRQELVVAYAAPEAGMEQLSGTLFEEVLKRDHVGRNDNFFALGGDSIRAMQVVSRLIKALGVDIPPTTLFRRPTPALLAVELTRLQAEQEIESLAAELQKLRREEVDCLLNVETRNDS